MKKERLTELKQLLGQVENIVIIPHRNPDGDAMGSTLGLALFLKKSGLKPVVISPNNYPDFLQWLPGNAEVVDFQKDNATALEHLHAADLIFTLDFNTLSRTGDEMAEVLSKLDKDFVMIDHHQQPDDYAKFTMSVPSASSTCELVYQFIEDLGQTDLIDENIATCLYAGIMTDTGSFRFPSTTGNTHRIIAALIDKGAQNSMIHQNIFDTKSLDQLKLLSVALQNLKVIENRRTAYITLSQKELDDHHFKKGDTEGFVNYGLALGGIIFAVIFIENAEEGIIKMSFRSKGDFDVNSFARKHYHGGGHLNAAGGRSTKSMAEATQEFESLLETYQNELKPQE